MRPLMPLQLVLAASLLAAPALAQPAGQGGAAPAADPADQLVGLFGATCLHYAADPHGMRGFIAQQGAPAMPPQARDAFLAGRQGQVFDVSVPGVNLALVSLDDGACEAVVEKANGAEVVNTLQAQARENQTPLTPAGDQGEKGPNGVRHTAFTLNSGGRVMHVLVTTEAPPPQVIIQLVPK